MLECRFQHLTFSGLFTISPSEGVLYLNTTLDYENQKKISFVVKCTDSTGSEDEAEVTVEILDSNDHYPVFERTLYTGYVAENSPPGPVYLSKDFSGDPLKVRAKDADAGRAGSVVYNIVENLSGQNNLFEVDHM